MLILNYAHPFTADQIDQIERLVGETVEVKLIAVQVDHAKPLGPQVVALADAAGLTNEAWSGHPILVNPPSLNFVAVALLAELHGRMGYFPTCLHIRPVPGSTPPRYEAAEVLNLQDMRNEARARRR